MSDLLERLKKTCTIKEADVLENSKFFNKKDSIKTMVPALNVALSGDLNGGLTPGLTLLAGQSKNFKTGISIILAKAYMDKYKDAVLLFFDSEFGTPKSYFESFGIDQSRVLHIPIKNIEELKFEIVKQFTEMKRGDKVVTIIDSVGNLASKKEVDDAVDGKSVADMSRAKAMKSLFRIVTPYLNINDIPMIAVAHTYQEMSLFPREIVGGGRGQMYSADTVWIIGRQQEKDGKDISGYNFIINVEKSRHVREKSKIPLSVSYDAGISKYSGLIEIALDAGIVVKPSNGWYSRINATTGEVEDQKFRLKDTNSEEFWKQIFDGDAFNIYIKNRYQLASDHLLASETMDNEEAQA